MTCDKYFECEYTFPFCTYYFDSINIISDEDIIIAFKSRLKCGRDQDFFYITEKNYINETIYYHLNINEDKNFIKIICQTKEKSFLFKDNNEKKYYLLGYQIDDCVIRLNQEFEGCEFIGIKMNNLKYRNFYIKNNYILGWLDNSIFLGNINPNNEIQIQKNIKKKSTCFISYVDLYSKCLIYSNSKLYVGDSDDNYYTDKEKEEKQHKKEIWDENDIIDKDNYFEDSD